MFMSLPGTPFPFVCIPEIKYGMGNSAPLYGETDGVPLYLDLLYPSPLPDTLTPAILFIQGSGWSGGDKAKAMYPWLNPLLAAHGFITISINHRFSWQAPFPAQIHDAKAAVRWLRANASRYHIDPERIGVWGFSSGAHLASLLGVTGDLPSLEGKSGSFGYSSLVQAVVVIAGPANFLHPAYARMTNDSNSPLGMLFGGTVRERAALMREASPLTHVTAEAPSFLLIQGIHDELVSFEDAKQFSEALRTVESEVSFLPLEAGHGLEGHWNEIGLQALSFFQKHLCR